MVTKRQGCCLWGHYRNLEFSRDAVLLKNHFCKLAKDVGMRVLECRVIDATNLPDAKPDEGGLSVSCIISTSHLCAHFWPERGEFICELASCREFDRDQFISAICKKIDAGNVEYAEYGNA